MFNSSRMLWITLVILWISLPTREVLAKEDFKCGEYEVKGVIRKIEGKKVVRLNEGSMNETTLSLSEDLSSLAEMYVDDPVTVKGVLLAPIEGDKGHVHSVKAAEVAKESKQDSGFSERYARDDIKTREVDPLHPDLDSSVKLLKERPCGSKWNPIKDPL